MLVGAVEAVACVGMIEEGWMAGTTGLSSCDSECPSNNLSTACFVPPNVIVSNSFGFGGQNASLIFASSQFVARHHLNH